MLAFKLCLALLTTSVAGVLVYWDCPHETYLKEQACLRQMGVKFMEPPNYDIPQILSNCRSRQTDESYTCFAEAQSHCNVSSEVAAIINSGLRANLEPGLDYLCGYHQLIEDNQDCFESITSRQEGYGCFQHAMKALQSIYDKMKGNDGLIDLDHLAFSSCQFVTDLSSCHYNLTLSTCGDESLAQVMANFWFSSNAEWCDYLSAVRH